ncbi:hypothetical protein GWK08_13530 [Leptobacterium flavescens]|uniref:Uncharacterized protein n=1 Tax=Leptobacterium flavescens TaxID=472055 RepID=A0A6P0URQ4_9FLAO|nr:hypothetical protein [Leptobacterium flavescens]NER14469.1 hypothetical protein [Leptobacterium flavescens]
MKKRNLKSLKLQKKLISNLSSQELKGGRLGTGSCICGTDDCPQAPSERPGCNHQ